MDTPPEGWDAYYAAHHADKEVSESQKKKAAQGAGSSRLITDDKPLSPVARQPETLSLTLKEWAASGSYTCHRCVGTVGRYQTVL